MADAIRIIGKESVRDLMRNRIATPLAWPVRVVLDPANITGRDGPGLTHIIRSYNLKFQMLSGECDRIEGRSRPTGIECAHHHVTSFLRDYSYGERARQPASVSTRASSRL